MNWWENYLTSTVFDKYDRWVAQYNSTCDLKKPYGIWQFTNRLTIGGKVFDGNWAYKDYPNITKEEETVTYEQWLEFHERFEKEQAAKAASAWVKETGAIDYCKEQKIMSGDADGRFRPQSNVTRQELAQVAMNLRKDLKGE